MLGRREGEAVRPKPFAVLRQEGRAGEEAEIHGIEVVAEAGERDLLGAHRAARRVVPLEHADRPAAACEVHGGGEAVVAGADDDRIEVHQTLPMTALMPPKLHAKGALRASSSAEQSESRGPGVHPDAPGFSGLRFAPPENDAT